MKEIKETLQRLITEMISDAKANNRYFTDEYLNELPISHLMANTHPLYRDDYKLRLSRISKQINLLMDLDVPEGNNQEELTELWKNIYL